MKITIHTKKVGCQSQLLQSNINNRDQNQPVRQPTDVTFEPAKENLHDSWEVCWSADRGDKHNIAYIFYLKLHVIA